MSDIAIHVENLSKRYRIGLAKVSGPRSLGKVLASPFRYLASTLRPLRDEEAIWALSDVSFEVKQGEVLGIIGRNGAGKSTLLKILSRITEPTSGRAVLNGRVGSLLEVGTGFHPELTGRENIYLNGAILGMKRAEIAHKFDEIVEFAEVEKFLDTPVKHYSSGMYVRLAFAVAAHLEPEILLVDEVLAVGDAEFQKKCLGKMGDVAKEGRTVLFVSHNMSAVKKLCPCSLLLNKGLVEMTNITDVVIDHYLDMSTSQSAAIFDLPEQDNTVDKKGRGLRIIIKDDAGILRNRFKIGERWVIRLEFEIQKNLKNVIAAIGLSSHDGISLVTFWSKPADLEPGCYYVDFLCDLPLKATYINIGVGLSEHEITFYYVEDVGSFEVVQVSNAEQPFRTVGAGLLLGNQNSQINLIKN